MERGSRLYPCQVIVRHGMTWWCDVTQHFVTELQAGLDELVAAHPERVMSARGTGTLCAIDCASVEDRTALVAGARARGVLIGVCGEKAIRFRPSVSTTTGSNRPWLSPT